MTDEPGMHEHRDPDDPLSPGDGPSPTDDDADSGEAMEDFISGMDHTLGAEDHTTAEEQLEGDTIDERTRREHPQNIRPHEHLDITDGMDADEPDDEAALIGEAAGSFGPEAPELEAMRIVDDLPGATDHPDDYVDE